MSAAVLGKVVEAQEKLRRARLTEWRDLVKLIADGKEPEPSRVESVLSGVSKSLEDLSAAVSLLQRRRALAKQLELAAKLDAEEKRIGEQIAAEREKVQKAAAACDAIIDPLGWRLREIENERRRAEQAADELRKTCPYPEIKEEIDTITRQLAELEQERQKLLQHASHCNGNASSCEARADNRDAFEADYRAEAAKHREKAAAATEKANELKRQIDELFKADAIARDKALRP